jgi:hypothetical protein
MMGYLKLSVSYISSPLTYIYNQMISTGTFRSRLKFSEIQTLLKKVTKQRLQLSDPSPCLQSSQKFFRRLYVGDYITT